MEKFKLVDKVGSNQTEAPGTRGAEMASTRLPHQMDDSNLGRQTVLGKRTTWLHIVYLQFKATVLLEWVAAHQVCRQA